MTTAPFTSADTTPEQDRAAVDLLRVRPDAVDCCITLATTEPDSVVVVIDPASPIVPGWVREQLACHPPPWVMTLSTEHACALLSLVEDSDGLIATVRRGPCELDAASCVIISAAGVHVTTLGSIELDGDVDGVILPGAFDAEQN